MAQSGCGPARLFHEDTNGCWGHKEWFVLDQILCVKTLVNGIDDNRRAKEEEAWTLGFPRVTIVPTPLPFEF